MNVDGQLALIPQGDADKSLFLKKMNIEPFKINHYEQE